MIKARSILLFVITCSPVWAATLTIGEAEQFSGTVVEKSWKKSSQSYCQGGSNYYVLDTKEGEYILNSERDPLLEEDKTDHFQKIQAQLHDLVGQKTKIEGQMVTQTLTEKEHCPNPMMQCISGDLTCDWIRILKIEKTTP